MDMERSEFTTLLIMEALYNNYFSPSGLASARQFYDYVHNRKGALDFLKTQESYTLHKPVVRKFRRRKYVVKGLNDLVQVDLADMTSLSRFNGGVKFLLVWIDCYSRFLKVIPLKNKSAAEVIPAFRKLLDEQVPDHIQSDKGTEFLNRGLQDLLKDNGVNFYTTQDHDTKAAFAERVIRTLKGKIYKYLTHTKSKRYIDVLQDLVLAYNRTKHSSTKQAPVNVVDNSINRNTPEPVVIKHKLPLSQRVRIALEKTAFSRGYTPNWSNELFYISEQLTTDPPTYKIKDADGQPILGSYYEQELQAV